MDGEKWDPSCLRMGSQDPRIVFLYASPLVQWIQGEPQEIEQLNIREEKRVLREALHDSQKRICYHEEVASSRNLRRLVTLGCRALHYTGHGMPTCLAFEDDTGEMHGLQVDVLRRLFAAGGATGIKFVFVSACHSQSAGEAFVAAGVPHVVAVRWDAKVRVCGVVVVVECRRVEQGGA